jgi:hypothetical protein
MTDLPIACTLTPDALRARRAGLCAASVHKGGGGVPEHAVLDHRGCSCLGKGAIANSTPESS